MNKTILIIFLCCIAFFTEAQLVEKISLPQPQHANATTLDDALARRQSVRKFKAGAKCTNQQLSDLLWAANGITHADGKRTAPSTMNWHAIDIYVVIETGVYSWDAKQNVLTKIAAGDNRVLTGTQDFVKDAAVCLVYVADNAKMKDAKADEKAVYAAADCGHISQNVYLWCAANGYGAVVRASIDKAALGAKLQLKSNQSIVLAQSIGEEVK